ncbi:hypothetical protein GC093_20605 [Paenibacillus sp. LMG 31456]|uniref:Holliday junction nuclease RuvC n=1 Tax=Paenibacillus foliorum TaxID=2654974 RepID=A0A972H3K8_9BACL|nr:hypothetical protein [Paenibacillus foliorum]NOU95611.1 hypothetical protein [Paenibacillus foliorum]
MPRYVGLDPSTKTGLVVLDEDGEVWDAREIEVGLYGRDPSARHMRLLVQTIIGLTNPSDRVAIEGFGFASQAGFLLGGIGWGIRMSLYERKTSMIEVAPSALKKFTGAGGNAGKEAVAVEVFKRWGFQHKSNNVTDAYVLAQIARALYEPVKLVKCQQEVIKKLKG